MAISPEKRLINKTVRNGTCWEWAGFKNSSGYGLIRFKGKPVLTHRLSYVLFKGQKLGKLYVCHSCDNPSCINPSHLFLGTPSDNRIDCMLKDKKRPQRIIFRPMEKPKPIASLTREIYQQIISSNRSHYYFKKKFKLSIRIIKQIRQDAFW